METIILVKSDLKMKCDNCGFDNVENAVYCQECGNPTNKNMHDMGYQNYNTEFKLKVIIPGFEEKMNGGDKVSEFVKFGVIGLVASNGKKRN